MSFSTNELRGILTDHIGHYKIYCILRYDAVYSDSLESIFREKPAVCVVSLMAGSSDIPACTFVEFIHIGNESKCL